MMKPALYIERIGVHTRKMVNFSRAAALRWRDGQRIDTVTATMVLGLSIMNTCLFKNSVNDVTGRVADAIEDVMEADCTMLHPFGLVPIRLPLPQVRRFPSALHTLDRVV